MCPLCISTLTLVVTGVLSAGGASAFAIIRLCDKPRARTDDQTGCAPERAS